MENDAEDDAETTATATPVVMVSSQEQAKRLKSSARTAPLYEEILPNVSYAFVVFT